MICTLPTMARRAWSSSQTSLKMARRSRGNVEFNLYDVYGSGANDAKTGWGSSIQLPTHLQHHGTAKAFTTEITFTLPFSAPTYSGLVFNAESAGFQSLHVCWRGLSSSQVAAIAAIYNPARLRRRHKPRHLYRPGQRGLFKGMDEYLAWKWSRPLCVRQLRIRSSRAPTSIRVLNNTPSPSRSSAHADKPIPATGPLSAW